MRVYVATSWRNEFQPGVVAALREDGHEVYDFKADFVTDDLREVRRLLQRAAPA